MLLSIESPRQRLSLGFGSINNLYAFEDIQTKDMPLVMVMPFLFALGLAALAWTIVSGANQYIVMAAAFGPAVIASIWMPATACLRHRARAAWGKGARNRQILSAVLTTVYSVSIAGLAGAGPLVLAGILFAAAWNPVLHLVLILHEARSYRHMKHIGEYAIFVQDDKPAGPWGQC